MARGMANGEPIVSQPATDEFREGYDRIFGDKPVQRGRWVYDVRQQRLVPADEYEPPARALDAPILSGRFYENVHTLDDGTDIGSRAKYQAYCREKGVTAMSDFSDQYYDNIHASRKRETRKHRKAALDRAYWEKFQK